MTNTSGNQRLLDTMTIKLYSAQYVANNEEWQLKWLVRFSAADAVTYETRSDYWPENPTQLVPDKETVIYNLLSSALHVYWLSFGEWCEMMQTSASSATELFLQELNDYAVLNPYIPSMLTCVFGDNIGKLPTHKNRDILDMLARRKCGHKHA